MSCRSDLLDSLRWEPRDPPVLKVCTSCRETLSMDDFHNNACRKDGKQSWCKPCMLRNHKLRAEAASAAGSVSEDFTVTQELVPDALYVMENPCLPGEIKIGRSREPEERAKQLCAGQNFRMVVRRTWGEKGFLEKTIHHKLKRRRVEEGAGVEWFRLSVEQAEAIITAAIIEDDISKS